MPFMSRPRDSLGIGGRDLHLAMARLSNGLGNPLDSRKPYPLFKNTRTATKITITTITISTQSRVVI